MNNSISLERLRELLNYNQETGQFTWIAKSKLSSIPIGTIAGTQQTGGYRQIRIDGSIYTAHRLAWFSFFGKWPREELDHINGVKTDNRIQNLREATRSQNEANKRTPRNNTTGFKGVSWNKARQCFTASFQYKGKHRHLGCFATAIEAHAKYRDAALEKQGEFACV